MVHNVDLGAQIMSVYVDVYIKYERKFLVT